ncbi:MAG: hypothetical protein CFE23_01880 [Flavobacterium sp. BFFFF1]|uniref:T9SS type B sorting domain-containing protein n=1 Tax=unclassified Flavobacterium TaxID=196869 RepID=UPI000BC623E0|nr:MULTISPECIES: T9SS type B sorting domain-containing protein [unclassified Flavobacterium]OYU82073.1 MAG: hypothetical protein CFE23_01880 [Flavobacterium sp. BFFFF1]
MKHIFLLISSFFLLNAFGQSHTEKPIPIRPNSRLVENRQGKLILNPVDRKTYLDSLDIVSTAIQKPSRVTLNNTPVNLCSNGGFEEFETINNKNYLKYFSFAIAEPEFPTECKSASVAANTLIEQYDPAITDVMASTVPSNYIDEFIGDIQAFDQYALKVNFKDSPNTLSVVRCERFKTNNENAVVFNYKAVLQSIIDDSAHDDNQPYFKVRVLRSSGQVVSEFCLIGDRFNCIFTQAPYLEADQIVLFTKNWQVGMLDISSIPNNENFTIEFMAARCGLSAHFGYTFIDDICLIHSDENTQGSIELDPLYKICPTMPLSVCGSYTIPNSGGVSAAVASIELKVFNDTPTPVYTTTATSSFDTVNRRFCFEIGQANLPNTTNGNYNVSVTINYSVVQTDCTGTNFSPATDPDANPGYDISFMNCNCTIPLQPASLSECDPDGNGKAIFNLENINVLAAGQQNGVNFSYFNTWNDAAANTNPIQNFNAFDSVSKNLYLRVSGAAGCFKVIAFGLIVKHPSFNISGILNVCGGSTVLTASDGASYLWNDNQTTKSITVSNTGTYSVTVTDATGCSGVASVTILPNQVAVQPTLQITQPNCFISTGTIAVTSAAVEYSFDNGASWSGVSSKSNLAPGTYYIKVKTASGCISYSAPVTIVAFLLSFPSYDSVDPTSCGGVGSITITEPGATEYSFDDGLTWETTNTKGNLPSGTYNIRIKNQYGCISNFNSVILNGQFLDAPAFTTLPPVCDQGGNITITTPAAEFSFDGGLTWVTTNVLENALAQTYLIKIKNAQGCTSADVYVDLVDFKNTYPDFTYVEPTCGTNGSITITTASDYYSFDGGMNWVDTATMSLPAGSYQLMIKNTAGCVSRKNYAYLDTFYLPYPNYTVIQPSCGNGGYITITTVADLYSFDGGTTWGTSAVSPALMPDEYLVQVKNNSGCVSYTQYVGLYEVFLPYPQYTVIQPTCETTGSISVTTSAAQYSFDDGNNWTTDAFLGNLPAGTYEVQIKDANNCRSRSSVVYLYQPYLPDPVYTKTDPFCLETTGTIVFEPVAGYEYSFDGGDTYQSSNDSGQILPDYYIIKVRNTTGCESRGIYVHISDPTGIPNTPAGDNNQLYCIFNNPTVAFLQAEGQNIQWFESAGATVPLTPDIPLVDGKRYFASQTINGCESPVRLNVLITLSDYVTPAADFGMLVCDDLNNGFENVDLNDYTFGLITDSSNPEDYDYTFYNTFDGAETASPSEKINNNTNYRLEPGENYIYTRVTSPNGCYKSVKLTLTVIPSPFITMTDHYFVCENATVTLTADAGFDSYVWSTGATTQSIKVKTPGNYNITVTEDHGAVTCSTTKTIIVVPSNAATVSEVITSDWTLHDNSVAVLLSNFSIGDYEYSLDNIHYQDDNHFYGLDSGIHEVFIRDKNGCGVTAQDIYLLMYANFFTPNGDGTNDTWKIEFSTFEPGLEIAIFDRFGKFLKQLFSQDAGWDGTFNGYPVPSDDYWFVVKRANGKEHRGHFTLKR